MAMTSEAAPMMPIIVFCRHLDGVTKYGDFSQSFPIRWPCD
jgi:hypothetical protein